MDINWGFDLTDFASAKEFEKLLRVHRLKTQYKREEENYKGWVYYRYSWRNANVKLVTTNNPITGKGTYSTTQIQKGYAGYIGITGEKKYVLSLANDIRNIANYKGESPFKREFV